MRSRTAIGVLALLAACTDVRDYRGAWHGPRTGLAPELAVGVAMNATASFTVQDVDKHGLAGRLTVDGVIDDAPIASISAAEADALASITFDGAPLRVYLAFAPASDGGGDALAVIALFDQRVELRVLRGGARPVYAIFSLTLAGGAAP